MYVFKSMINFEWELKYGMLIHKKKSLKCF